MVTTSENPVASAAVSFRQILAFATIVAGGAVAGGTVGAAESAPASLAGDVYSIDDRVLELYARVAVLESELADLKEE